MKNDPNQGLTAVAINLIAVGNIVLHLAFFQVLGFHRDELLYFSFGSHLAAGYASVPPLTGLIAFSMTKLLGPTLFAARLLPALFSGIMVLLAAGIAKEMKGGNYARILAAVGIVVFPVNLRAFFLFQPVFLDIFFWTLVFYLLIRWINTKNYLYILFLGICSGTGIMNKYTLVLLLFSIAVAFLFSNYRRIFLSKYLYVATLVAILIILPNIIWQIRHQLPVIMHMQALRDSQLVNVNRITFLTDQLFLGSMSMLLLLPGLASLFLQDEMKRYKPLALASILVLIILLVLRGKSYYTAGIYPFLIAAGAVYWEKKIRMSFKRILFVLVLVVATIPIVPMGIPVFGEKKLEEYFAYVKDKVGFEEVLRDEDGNYHPLPQDYADMIGWYELAKKAGLAYQEIEDKQSCFVYCENYGQAGALNLISREYGVPEPVCFSESFFYWAPRKLPVEIRSALYVNDEIGDDILDIFRDCRVAGRITNPLAREYGTTIWVCRDPVKSFNEFYEKRVNEINSPF